MLLRTSLIMSTFLILAAAADAQSAKSAGTAGGGNGPSTEIVVTGNVTSSVEMDIRGVGATATTPALGTNSASTTGAVSLATVSQQITADGSSSRPSSGASAGQANLVIDFGTFSALNPDTASNASFKGRTLTGKPGAIVAASLSITLRYSGATDGRVSVARKNPQGTWPDVPADNLRVMLQPLARWTASTDGVAVPSAQNPGFDVCAGSAGIRPVSGTTCVHQLAVFVPDTQSPGPFTTVVTYTATAM